MSASLGFIVTEITQPREPIGPDPFIAEFEREPEHATGRPELRARPASVRRARSRALRGGADRSRGPRRPALR